MNKIILVTGGSRSGKSEYAEELLRDTEDVLYIATAIVTDDEMRKRIDKHIERRNKKWATYEGYKNLHNVIKTCKEQNILLDCVTIMITNLMFDKEIDFDKITMDQVEDLQNNIKKEFEKFIIESKQNNKNLIMVTNEVGSGLIPEYRLSRIYRDITGYINQCVAKLCDEVYFISCGLPIKLK